MIYVIHRNSNNNEKLNVTIGLENNDSRLGNIHGTSRSDHVNLACTCYQCCDKSLIEFYDTPRPDIASFIT